jgi:hypothetical protein
MRRNAHNRNGFRNGVTLPVNASLGDTLFNDPEPARLPRAVRIERAIGSIGGKAATRAL